jgi:uroporphyrin-III C-methyltransferase/precorrin-2 dehydrogenase/sirohydrochlorin ferrochelatase
MTDVSASRTGERGTQTGEPGRVTLGRVVLVGAGPGDPDLLTVKAAREIGAAEVIFADRLVGKGVLALAAVGAEIVHVGKSKGEHSVPQDEIHARMIAAAKAGKRVVRLKGGDPFIFGRGGEEVVALRAAGVEVDVVPGISAAMGVAARAQIPLTHRDSAQAVTFVTGHAKLGEEPDLDWSALARGNQTVVVYMGVGTAGTIAARLVAAGREPSTPVAVIENGTRAEEIRAFGVLGELSEIIQRAGIQGPALLIIGEVVAAAGSLPLKGGGQEGVGREHTAGSVHTERDPHLSVDVDGHAGVAPPPSRGRKGGEAAPKLSDLWRMFS